MYGALSIACCSACGTWNWQSHNVYLNYARFPCTPVFYLRTLVQLSYPTRLCTSWTGRYNCRSKHLHITYSMSRWARGLENMRNNKKPARGSNNSGTDDAAMVAHWPDIDQASGLLCTLGTLPPTVKASSALRPGHPPNLPLTLLCGKHRLTRARPCLPPSTASPRATSS